MLFWCAIVSFHCCRYFEKKPPHFFLIIVIELIDVHSGRSSATVIVLGLARHYSQRTVPVQPTSIFRAEPSHNSPMLCALGSSNPAQSLDGGRCRCGNTYHHINNQ
jgi:hypothetical protein